MHPQYTPDVVETPKTDRQLVEQTDLRVAVAGLDDFELRMAAHTGHPAAMRVAAWGEMHRRGQDWTHFAVGVCVRNEGPEYRVSYCDWLGNTVGPVARCTTEALARKDAAEMAVRSGMDVRWEVKRVTVEARCRNCGATRGYAVDPELARVGTALRSPYECRNNACGWWESDLVVTAVRLSDDQWVDETTAQVAS